MIKSKRMTDLGADVTNITLVITSCADFDLSIALFPCATAFFLSRTEWKKGRKIRGARQKGRWRWRSTAMDLSELYSRLFSSVGLESRRQVHRWEVRRHEAPLFSLFVFPTGSFLSRALLSERIRWDSKKPWCVAHARECVTTRAAVRIGSRRVQRPPHSHSPCTSRSFSAHSGDAPRYVLGPSSDVRGEITPTTAKNKKKIKKHRGQCKRISASKLFSYIFSSSAERGNFQFCDFRC